MAYYSESPWGEDRADLRMGILGSSIVNCWVSKKSKAIEPKDLIPRFSSKAEKTKAQSPEQMIEIAKAFAAIYGGG